MSALCRTEWRAVGTTCAAAVTADSPNERNAQAALSAAQDEVAACERELSRFDPASDLSRLNAAGGRWTPVGRRLLETLRLALEAREDTGGRARLEPGAAVDLGGIGKGYAAGRALASMLAASSDLAGGLVDLGGDIAVAGASPEGGPWLVAVADPRHPGQTLAVLALDAGGVVTSGRDARRFGPGRSLHHLIDPETGESALAGPLTVTVVAPDPARAEVHATTLAIAGPAEAEAHVAARPPLAALYVPQIGPAIPLGELPVVTQRLVVKAA
jgi:thiamine biosynthesis lipoprotein ApbE